MSVQVSYKKQIQIFILLFLVILGVAEGISRIYESVNPHCGFLKSDVMKDVDIFLKIKLCYDHDALKWYEDIIIQYEPNQHFETININSHGFRGPEITKEKEDGTYRIFMVGGSTTFGAVSSSDENTIPGILQNKINKLQLDTKIEVINAGIGGAGSAEEKFYIETKLLNFEPDLFIIYDGVNDAGENVILETLDEEGKTISLKPIIKGENEKTNNDLKFKNFPFYRTPFVAKQIFFNPNIDLPKTEISEQSIQLFKQRWTDVCELGKKEGFSMVVSVQPMLGSSTKILSPSETIRANEKDFLSGRLQTLDGMVEVLNELDRHCTKTIDLTNVFDNVTEPIYLDGAHLYDSGNKIVAEKIFEEIIPIILDEI